MHGAQVAVAEYCPDWWPANTRLLIRRVLLDPEQVSAGPRSRRRRTLHPDQRALPLPGLAGAGAIYACSFILTSLDVPAPGKAAAVEHWYRRDLLPGRIGPLAVQPGQEILPASCAAAIPASSCPAPNPRSRCLMGLTAVSSALITPSRSHSSVIAARPAFGVSAGSGAPIRGCCRDLPAPLRILFTR